MAAKTLDGILASRHRLEQHTYVCAACTCINYCFFILSAWLVSVMIGYYCNYTSRESNGWMSGLKFRRFTEEGPGLGRNI